MRTITLKRLVLASVFLAVGLVLPFLTGQIPSLGQSLLPLHIPVLLGGFFLGAPLAGLVGLILPILRSLIFGMPPLFPTAVAMSFELATYGYLVGWFNAVFPRRHFFVYTTLILSMVGGRIIWGMVTFVLLGITGGNFNWQIFVNSVVWTSLPGIILHILLIPALVFSLQDSRGGTRR